MKKVIVGIGIPGSGKTTFLKEFSANNGYSYICPDDIREELTGNVSDQSKNAEVWQEAYKRTERELSQGNSVVFDATFANLGQRKDFLSFARLKGAEKIQGVCIEVGLEIAKERNQLRERKVPEAVLERMHRSLTEFPPEISDGFDSIFTLDGEQRLIELTLERDKGVIRKEFKGFA